MSVAWVACGALTDTSIAASAKPGATLACRLAVSTDPTMASGVIFGSSVTSDSDGYVQLTKTGLTANTSYSYCIEVAGTLDTSKIGSFTTAPVAAGHAASFTFGFSSCNVRSTTHPVFAAIAARKPLFFMHIGDLGYSDIGANTPSLFQANYDGNYGSSTVGPAVRSCAWDYVWDDHDWGGDNSDGTAVAGPAAQSTFRQCAPHYTLAAADSINRTFQIGRAWFIVTDLRSFRSPVGNTDDATKTMLGATQKTWFKAQLLAAKAAGAAAIFWASTSVWNVAGTSPFSGQDADNDHWGAYSTERTEIANYIRDNSILGVVVLTGDAHSSGYAKAKNGDFATGGGAPIPVLMASPLDQTQTSRNCNWDVSFASANAGMYGIINVTDDGSLLTWDYHVYQADATTGVESEPMSAFRPWFIPANPPVVGTATVARDYDPTRLVGFKTGDKVASWPDRVAGDALAQATAAIQPTFYETDGGFPSIRLNKVQMSTSGYTPSGTTNCTIVAVVRRAADHVASAGYIWDGTTTGGRRAMQYDNTAGQNQRLRLTNNASTISSASSDKDWHVVAGTYGGVSERIRVDGVQVALSANTATVALAGFTIGGRWDNSNRFIGDIARLLIFEGSMTDTDLAIIEKWLLGTYLRDVGQFVADRGMLVRGRTNVVLEAL